MLEGRRLGTWLVPASFLAGSLALLLLGAGRGFELSDEGYYVAWIADPAAYGAMIHPFGIFFHPLWTLAPSLFALRLAGIALVLVTGATLGWWAAAYYRGLGFAWDRLSLTLIAMLGSLANYSHWLLTPSYNILANAGAALLAAGLFGWATRDSGEKRDMLASSLVGLGACLAFLGKPTLAAIAAVVVGLLLLWPVARGRPGALARSLTRAAIVGLACFGPLLALIATTVSLSGFLKMVANGRGVLDFDNSPARLAVRGLRELAGAPPVLVVATTVAIVAAVLLAGREPDEGERRRLRLVGGAVLIVALLALPIDIARGLRADRGLWQSVGPGLVAASLALAAFGAASRARAPTATAAVVPIAALALLPFAIAFGSANPWFAQTGLSLFAVVVAIALAARLYLPPRAAALADLAVCAAVAGLLTAASLTPYRLPATIFAQDEAVRLPFAGGEIMVDRATAASFDGFAAAAHQVPAGTPIVDLSNSGPGPVLLLGGRAPFFPWVNTNYPNAVRLADAIWNSLTPEERGLAWLITPAVPALADSAPVRHAAANRGAYRLAARLTLPDGRAILLWRPAALSPG